MTSQIPTRQAILGRSGCNTLVITMPPAIGTRSTLTTQPNNNAGIMRLPDELLLQVVKYVAYPILSQLGGHVKNYADSAALAKTCLRFYRLTIPVMYSRLFVSINSITSNSPSMSAIAARKLHQTLSQNPWLRQHCRALHLGIGDTTHPKIQLPIVEDLAHRLTQTRRLSIHGGFQTAAKGTWSVIRTAVAHMPLLEEVHLHREGRGLCLPDVFEALGSAAHLRVLHLGGISPTPHSVSWGAFKVRPANSVANSANCYSKGPVLITMPSWRACPQKGSSSLSSLSITDFSDSPAHLANLMSWPARLESFSFKRMYSNEFGPWTLPTVLSALHQHKASLQTLSLGGWCVQRGFSWFDFAKFDSLQSLSLPACATGCRIGDISWDVLKVTRLQVFRWSLAREGEDCESLFDFGQQHEDWLRAFAIGAWERKLPLRRIEIEYQPFSWSVWEMEGGVSRPEVYPWDRMDRLKSEMQEMGILLSYDTPTVSRDEFEGKPEVRVDGDVMTEDSSWSESWLETEEECQAESNLAQANTILNYFSATRS